MRKIFKFIKYFIFLLLFINIIDLLCNNINSTSDLSKENKVTIYDNNNIIIYERYNIHDSSYVHLDEINEITKNVFIEVEDRRFYYHKGVDLITTTKAFINNFKNDTLIGGSTITQQYVKNLYLSNEKSYIRKIKECYYALRIEQLYNKDEILEGYLNTIYFNNGIYGINDASRYYFNKTPMELTLKEAVSLVSVIKSPTKYCIINNLENNKSRSKLLLNSLLERNIISKKDYNEAVLQELNITKTSIEKYSNSILYFKDLVLKEIEIDSDIHIYTNFNSELNYYIDTLLKDISCDVSIVVLDKNGYIISCIGNKDYLTSEYNIATMSTRMVGSTIKPLLYYEALSYGMKETDCFISEKNKYIIDNKTLTISNYNNIYDNKLIDMKYALATSDNIYAFKTHLFIGVDKLSNSLRKFNIEPIDDKYTLCLGSQDISLLQLTNIYNTFLNMGYYSDVKSYNFSECSGSKKINVTLRHKLLNEDICIKVNELMRGTFDTSLNAANKVTGNSIAHLLNKDVVGKSGLTDYDSYMIGSTDSYTIGIWSGYSDNEPLSSIKNKKLPKELFYKIVNAL